jgi:hypothetical protein
MFDRDTAVRALEALASELDSRGVVAHVFVVGGAAMTLAFDARRMTRDIEAVFSRRRRSTARPTQLLKSLSFRTTG